MPIKTLEQAQNVLGYIQYCQFKKMEVPKKASQDAVEAHLFIEEYRKKKAEEKISKAEQKQMTDHYEHKDAGRNIPV